MGSKISLQLQSLRRISRKICHNEDSGLVDVSILIPLFLYLFVVLLYLSRTSLVIDDQYKSTYVIYLAK